MATKTRKSKRIPRHQCGFYVIRQMEGHYESLADVIRYQESGDATSDMELRPREEALQFARYWYSEQGVKYVGYGIWAREHNARRPFDIHPASEHVWEIKNGEKILGWINDEIEDRTHVIVDPMYYVSP